MSFASTLVPILNKYRANDFRQWKLCPFCRLPYEHVSTETSPECPNCQAVFKHRPEMRRTPERADFIVQLEKAESFFVEEVKQDECLTLNCTVSLSED